MEGCGVNHGQPQSGQSRRKVCFATIKTCAAFAWPHFGLCLQALSCCKLYVPLYWNMSLGYVLPFSYICDTKFSNISMFHICVLILLLRKRILQKSQPPLYPCQLSEYVCSGGGVRHIGYTCERMENEKYSTLQPNWIFNIHDCEREQIPETRIRTKFWIQTKTEKSSFETFLALDLALVEMHKPAITLKGNFSTFQRQFTISSNAFSF